MDLDQLSNLQRTFTEQNALHQDALHGVWGTNDDRSDSGGISRSETSEFCSEARESQCGISPTHSQDTLSNVSSGGQCDLHSVGAGSDQEQGVSGLGSTDHVSNMQQRIRNLQCCERTERLHSRRIVNTISRMAGQTGVDEFVCRRPYEVIKKMSELYDNKTYKANSIKSYLSSIRHYILSRGLEPEHQRSLLDLYDAEFSLYERMALNDVAKYKSEMTYIDPEDVRKFVLSNIDQRANFHTYLTGLIYAKFPLRDDLTNIQLYTTKASSLNDKGNFVYLNEGEGYLQLNKTKTIPKRYPPLTIQLGDEISNLLKSSSTIDRCLFKGRRSVCLSNLLRKMGIEFKGGAVNYLRRSHAKKNHMDDTDTLLNIMGHSAMTHGRHYL